MYGYSHTLGGYDGGQAEYVRVPFIGVDDVRQRQARCGALHAPRFEWAATRGLMVRTRCGP
ncbi:hypothetical protein KYC5002_28195 [Archangium violaceum]|uniref:hypothetical protein n=1 Tax=Archangium violaceum TaxID=83451 RepID=UPI002B31691F|nr:hypothetical protein KYC5002_28195 [Archangium gephyra]